MGLLPDPDVGGDLGNRVRALEAMEADLRNLGVAQVPQWNGTGWDGWDPTSPEAWTTATYVNGWATQAGQQAAAYYKHAGIIGLRGTMNGAAATAQTAFTLPGGYRPATLCRFPLSYWDSTALLYRAGAILVGTDGTVKVEDNTASAGIATTVTFVSLDVVNFRQT